MGDQLRHEGILSKGYGIIPKLVMKDKDLTIESKAIYSYLCSYAGNGGTAFPSVGLMCSDLGISETRYLKHRKTLLDKGYITVKRERKDRKWSNNVYTIVHSLYPQNEGIQNEGIQNEGIQNEGTINNSINNNSINNNSDDKDILSGKAEPHIPFQEVVEYLNEKAETKYRHTGKKTQTLIKARYSEGFNLDDFKKVIDIKVNEWLNDKSMNKYLRPETLFGTKFESYLNQKQKTRSSNYDTSEYDDLY